MNANKAAFIRQLARFLVEAQAAKSICLQVEQTRNPVPLPVFWGKEWAALRQATPLFGYPTAEEAEAILTEFLK